MTEADHINPSNLSHQVEETDRISMLGAFRAVGLLVMLCGLLQFVGAFVTAQLDDPIWVLSNSPKWNGAAAILVIGAVCFLLPAPASTRFGTQPMRLFIRLTLGVLALCYVVLAGLLIRATDNRIAQLDYGQFVLLEQRDMIFGVALNKFKSLKTREEMDSVVAAESLGLRDMQTLALEEYRNLVLQRLLEIDNDAVQSIKLDASEAAAETITYCLREIIRSSLFGLALLLVALAAPRPPLFSAHEQSA